MGAEFPDAGGGGGAPSGAAGGDLLGSTYPNPVVKAGAITPAKLSFDPATQAELDAVAAAAQPLDSDLTAIAALSTTSFGRSVLAQADAAALRTLAGLGTAATQASGAFDAAGAAAAAQAASQPLDSDLTAIAALTTTAFGRAFLALADGAATRTAIGLVIGTDVAAIASPALTGNPTAPTQTAGNNSTRLATTAYADGAVATETSRATTAEGLLAPKASPALTGSPTAPTPTAGDNSTKIATTAYVDAPITTTTQAVDYALVLADAGTVVEGTKGTAQVITIPANASVAYPVGTVIEIVQMGAGQITLTPDGGVTIRTASSLTTRALYSSVGVRKRATNEWVASGDLT